MDLVLGLSLTSSVVRWVLVEGTTGEGAPIDRGSLDIPAADALDANLLLDAVLTPDLLAGRRLHAVGVTCTGDATSAASVVLAALTARGEGRVVAVADGDAATALASGIADITDYDDVAVCIVEPFSALVALVAAGSATVECIDRPQDGADALELTSSVIAALDVNDRRPDAIFVVGSDDVDVIVSCFEAVTEAPVFAATEADLALARGAALAAAQSGGTATPPRAWQTARIAALAVAVVAAVLTFVVSVSIALGLSLTPDAPANPARTAIAAREPAPAAVPQAAPTTTGFVPDTTPKLAMTMVVAAPPPPPAAEPEYASPPAYQPPAPVYAPPPPPYREPRLRDRIIERIPVINRFHEPQR